MGAARQTVRFCVLSVHLDETCKSHVPRQLAGASVYTELDSTMGGAEENTCDASSAMVFIM